MQPFITRIKTNLNGVLQMTQMIDGIMMTGDDIANQIIVELHRDRVPVTIPESTRIVGYFIRPDGYTLEIDGEIIGENQAMVEIPALAYQVPGALSIAIRMFTGPQEVEQRGYYDSESGDFVLVDDLSIVVGPHGEPIETRTTTVYDNKIVVAAASCFVQITETDSIIEPGHKIPDLNDVIQKLAEIDAKQVEWQGSEDRRVVAESGRVAAEENREVNEAARQYAIQNMSVSAVGLTPFTEPTATITDVDGHKHITFGLIPGSPFAIKKAFASVAEMQAYTGTDINLYDFVVIASNVQDPDNSKLYMKIADGWFFVTDLSGSQGIQGPQGIQGLQGERGPKGEPGWGGAEVQFEELSKTLVVTFGSID